MVIISQEDETQSQSRIRIAYDNVVRRAKQRKNKLVAMETLKKGIFHRLSISPFHQRQSSEKKKLIEDHLCALIPEILAQTPNHPPYAEMIERAIENSEEEGGVSEASISSYIVSTYQNLPWAHSHLLPHHLRKLTEAGEIIAAPNSRYLLPLSNPSLSPPEHQQPPPPPPPRKQKPQPPKRGRGRKPSKKTRSEQKETPPQEEEYLETERQGNRSKKKTRSEKKETPQQEEHLETEKQLQQVLLSWKRGRGGGQQTHPEEAIRTEDHFDGECSIVHPSEPPPDVGSGEKVMEIEAPKPRRSRRRQKLPEEVIRTTETKGSVDDHVDGDSLMTPQPLKPPHPVVIEENETLPLLNPSTSTTGEPVNQPEEVTTVAIDASNNGTTMSIVSCCEPIVAAVEDKESSLTNDEEEPLQMLLPQNSREQLKLEQVRTNASDVVNDSLMVLSSGPIIAAMEGKEASASAGEDVEPFQKHMLPNPHRDEELNHPEPEVGSFATGVSNYGSLVLSSGNPSQQQSSSALVDEQQKHSEVATAASVANNNGLMVLSVEPLMVVDHAVKENGKAEEQPPQQQQTSLQCTDDDDDDVIVKFCWNPKSVRKEKEGKPNKQSEPTRRHSLRLTELCQKGKEAQTEPLTGTLLALADVKIEVEETSVMEAELKEKEKQPSQWQQKPNKKAKNFKKELGTKTKLSQQQQRQQLKRHREEQTELLTEIEPSQTKRRDMHSMQEPKEMETKTELSLQQLQLQQKQQAPKGQGKRGRPPKGLGLQQKLLGRPPKGLGLQQKQQGEKLLGRPPKGLGLQQKQQGEKLLGRPPKGLGLQQKQQVSKVQMKLGRPPKGLGLQQKQQVSKGQKKLGRPPKGPGLQQKQKAPKGQSGSIKKESKQLEKKTMPLYLSAASEDGDIQSGKSQMAEIDQEPSEPQKKARGQGRPSNKEPAETTVKGRGGSTKKESNQLGKKTMPLHLSAAAKDGDVQSGKSQMAEIDQEPSEPQKKARGRGRPPNKEHAEATVKVRGQGRERSPKKQKTTS